METGKREGQRPRLDCVGERHSKQIHGERLVGCIERHRGSWRGSNRLFMELPEEDLTALHMGLMHRETNDS